ncbi:hypothetical protein IFR04_013340 [Cadophora malorum]|uniref:DUF2415 domain-containing protein n=1 Tax=Cadophora malorum TaxID=108018 RepID=A0A8H7T5H9_9HELO|nr:hypothetical protein IFR04_013340 [Cadophora malorum]
MAVKEESLHHATENLILPNPRKYYRATIDTSHWQLRSLISSPEQDIVYFPNGTDIISINSKTRERELIASLTFLPRCLVASKDWLCCGGDNGNYTAISLKNRSAAFDTSSFLDSDPDARLPLDLDPTRRTNIGEMIDAYRRIRGRAMTTHSEKIGAEIVNCITLWSPRDDLSERVYKVPVAVVSNNDCTVSILNVATSDTLETLKLPDFVNRSAISPDGELLVAICDDPFLYIHKRMPKAEPRRERFENKRSPIYQWVLAGRIQLESQRQADRSQMRGSFALSFSRSGKYLAVATQYGIISIFDAECLTETQSLMVSFTTSRPGRQAGAVRAMDFSPGPFDLLAWTESSGRVGIADVRTLFNSRQLILINSNEENVERVLLSDRSGQRYGLRSLRSESPPSANIPDYLGADLERRHLRSLLLDRDQDPPTAAELDVLEVSRIARRQRDAANAAREVLAEASATSRWGPWAEGRRSTNSNTNSNGEGSSSSSTTTRLVNNAGLPTSLRDFVSHDRSAASFRAFMDERNRESARRTQLQQQEPRRRSSMLLAAAETAIERETIGTPRNDDTFSGLERLTLTPGRRDRDRDRERDRDSAAEPGSSSGSGRAPESNTPWTDIESIYRAARQADAPITRSTRLRVELGAEDDDQTISINPREFAHRLRQPWRPTDDGTTFGLGALSRDENGLLDGVLRAAETMGCCWSPDGRIL